MSTAERVQALERLWSEESSGAQRELTEELVRKWAEEMPQAASEWVTQKPAGALQRSAARSVAVIWANQNVQDAAAWVRHWPENEKESGLIAVAYEAARTAPESALWLASELSPTPARDGLITHTVREWASQDAEAPISWAEKMKASSLQEDVFANAAISLSEKDPIGAANLALQKLSPGARQDNTVVSIVQRWTQTAPAEAAAWVARFPQGEVRDASVENLVQLWTDKNPKDAVGWLEGLENGPVRDGGIGAYARKIAPSEPEAAVTWVQKINDPEAREKELESVLSVWMQTDRQKASHWLEAASVPEETKTRLLK